MGKKQTKSANPAYPDADPTAPGGMSRAALRVELAEKHGVAMDESKDITWPVLIDMVAQGRLDREAEAKVKPVKGKKSKPKKMSKKDKKRAAKAEKKARKKMIRDDGHGPEFAGSPDGIMGQPAPLPEDFETDEVFDPETLFAEIHAARAEEEAANPPIFLPIPGIRDYVFDGHAGAGPSASERWMTCTMSLSPSRRFLETLSPNQQRTFAGANLAARQGTTAHAVGEAKANHMLGRIDDETLSDTLLMLSTVEEGREGEEYTDEMDEYVQEYVDLIKTYADERGPDTINVERRVEAAIPLDGMHEGEVYIIRGSADVTIDPTEDDPVLVVGDLKYGDGLWVDVDENSQARLYALGVLGELVDEEGNLTTNIERVRLHIIQPRLGGIKTWEESLDDLFDWRDDVLSPALTKALYGEDEGATFNPTPTACQFCPARGGCPALAEQRLSEATELFDVIQETEHSEGIGAFPETSSLSNEQLGSLYGQITGLVGLHKEMKAEVERRLFRGLVVPGFHLVNYTPPRKWVDTDVAADKIKRMRSITAEEKAALFKPATLVTPKQAVTVLGKEKADRIKEFYETPDKRPVVSTGPNDRRTKWEGRAPEDMFEDESTPEDKARAIEEMFPDE